MSELSQVSVYILNGKKKLNPRELHRVYDLSFKLWHETWDKTYREDFNSLRRLFSDEFTRQDDILVLFYKGECAALSFFTDVNMNDEAAQKDSYFKSWPIEAIEKLCSKGSNLVICTQFTVNEKFRQQTLSTSSGFMSWKVLLSGMIAKYYMASEKDAMSGILRITKGMDKLTYTYGATPIIERTEYQAGADKTSVALVGIYQDNVREFFHKYGCTEELDQLWEGRNGNQLKIAA